MYIEYANSRLSIFNVSHNPILYTFRNLMTILLNWPTSLRQLLKQN